MPFYKSIMYFQYLLDYGLSITATATPLPVIPIWWILLKLSPGSFPLDMYELGSKPLGKLSSLGHLVALSNAIFEITFK